MNLGFGNNIRATLAADINSTQTAIAVMPGTGALFAKTLQADTSVANPSFGSTLYAKVTLTDALETVFEICHLLSVSGDNLTVIRGQEGTAAKGWSLNDVISNFSTRGSENTFVQIEDLQNGKYLSATAGGTENALTIALPSTFYINGGNTFALRSTLHIKPTLTNTGATTVQLTVSGKIVGTYPLVKGNNRALEAGDIAADSPIVILFSQELSRFLMINPAKGLVDSDLFLLKSNNLSDLTNVSDARTNLGVYSSSVSNDLFVLKAGDTIGWLNVNDALNAGGNINSTKGSVYEQGQRVYSPNNPPPYPVTSVNWATGNVMTATAALGSSGWHKDGATGMITQWGIITRTGYVTPVTFPTTFPNGCMGVFLTLNTSISDLADSTNNLRAVNTNNSGFTYASAGVAEISSFWFAIGY